MSKPNSRVQKISLEIVNGLIGMVVAILLAYWLAYWLVFSELKKE